MPDDIDVFFTDEKEYNKCIEDYKDDIFICRPNDDSFGYAFEGNDNRCDVIYLPYKDAKINILLIKYDLKWLHKHFDIEFCALIWDGKNFNRSSNKAVSSAKHGVSFQSTDTSVGRYSYYSHYNEYSYVRYFDRIRKYEKRGYRFVYYTNDIKNQREKEVFEREAKEREEFFSSLRQ